MFIQAQYGGGGLGFLIDPTMWDQSDKASTVTLSNNNLTAAASSSSNVPTRATVGWDAGKRYFEVLMVSIGSGGTERLRVGLATKESTGDVGGNAVSISFDNMGIVRRGGTTLNDFAAIGNGYIIRVAYDGAKVYFGVDGVWQGGANPATGVGGYALTGPLFPAFTIKTATTITANFGAMPFSFVPPAGYELGW